MIGQRLGDRYEIHSELGRGGMGVVYRARDPLLSREVAVKLIPPALLTAEAEQRFHSEAQVVAQMDHPSIVPIYDFGRHEDSLFLVMPLLPGTNLRHLIREQSLLLGDVLGIGIDVAEAVEYSHARGVVHRDIKPENIMVSREDGGKLRVRLMDFGLARRRQVTVLTKSGMLVGTVAYVSPEQVTGKVVTGCSDIYSLGTVLYECVTNDVPFTGEMQAVLYRIVHELPQPPRSLGAEIDEELEAIILSCLGKEPERRPQRAADLAQALRNYRSRLRESERRKSMTITRTLQVSRPARSPFVGRMHEIKELQERLNRAVGGECHFVVISGEPGVGKTRLLEELENLVRARQIRLLHGRFMEQDDAFPYHGFCEAIQECFHQKESGSSPSALPDLSDLGADLVSVFPMLGEIEAIRAAASGSGPTVRAARPRAPEDRTHLFELLARTLTRLAGGKPLVLLFEELHGASVSIEALQYIVRRLGPTPTLIVGTYRSTEVDRRHPLLRMLEAFQGDRRFSAIALSPFSASAHRQFLATLVGGTEITDDLAARLFRGSEGNPFFTKELVRSLLNAGTIVQNEIGAWTLSDGMEIASGALPTTIQQAVEKRIGRLPDDLREILSIASVMGKTFDYRDLELLAEGVENLDEAVDRLVHEGFIEEERHSRSDRLTFSSGVVRDVLYRELPRRRRRSLHRRYAVELEKRYSGRLERVYPQLVHHYSEGDVPEKTVEYGLKHARKSLAAFSPDEAVRSAKTALGYLDEAWEGDRSLEGEARMLLAAGYRMAGENAGALRETEAALRIFEREDQPTRTVGALLEAARAAWHARQTEEARRWVERGIVAARAADDSERLGDLLHLAATLANLRGEYTKATEYLEEAKRLGPVSQESEAKEEIPPGGRLFVALANPVAADLPVNIRIVEEREVLANVFEPLLATDADGNLVPGLCEGWEALDGGRSLLLTLRRRVGFEDGHALKAEDVKRSFEISIRRCASDLPPALAAIRGASAFREGKGEGLSGIVIRSDFELEIQLEEPLPIYAAFLTDSRSAIISVTPDGQDRGSPLVGTGPFRLALQDRERVVLERNPRYWKGPPANLDAIEFRHGLSSTAIAAGLRSGELDVARDLLPQDLEEILRDSRFRGGLLEAAQKVTYFVLFNARSGPAGSNPLARRALAGVVRARDLVWETLGRFAQPASGLLPPGILGHDPGKRRPTLSLERAQELLRSSEMATPIPLKAAVNPLIRDRYGSLLQALFSVWADLGAEVSIETPDMASFLEALRRNEGLDLVVRRWVADYDDPDTFTHELFHSKSGLTRSYYCSAEADQLLEAARSESRPAVRESLYRKFENMLLEADVVVPLFHDIDYRIASPRVRGIKLSSSFPAVNYAELGKVEAAPAADAGREEGGILHIPTTARLESLDPSLADTVEEGEVLPSIYETLLRDIGEAQIVPWLVAEFSVQDGGRTYRFRLRDDVRFHDGRRLTARDVRYSLERLLQNRSSHSRRLYAPILGARTLLDGERGDLAGFHIHSATEFTIELERPVSFFLALLSFTAAAVVPEGARDFDRSWHEGTVGTGPFRVTRFDPRRALELERNPYYWRSGYPRSQGLAFSFGVSPVEILSGFRAGRFSLAADLFPGDVEALRRDPTFAACYREAPRLSTCFLAFNTHRSPLRDAAFRKDLVRALDVAWIVRQALGQLAIPAHGLIPPGLLGYEPLQRPPLSTLPLVQERSTQVGLSVAVHPVFTREYSAFFEKLSGALHKLGVRIRPSTDTMTEFSEAVAQGSVDLALGRWSANYPDADTFARILHSQEGWYGAMCGSPEIDTLIEKGRAETDPEARHSIYRQLGEIVAREARLLPLFHEQVYRFARPEVEGLSISYCFAYDTLRIRDR